jgi:uncharacterized lipoprotein YmbA
MRPRTNLVLLVPLAALALLPGCLKRSPIAETWVLDPVAARGASSPDEKAVAVVGVLKVAVPGWLERPQVASRGADGAVVADEYARWGEPFARGVQRVLVENLAALLPDRRVVAAPFPPSTPVDHRVDVTISEAARQADGSVLVEARWALVGRRGETLVQRRSSHRATPAAGVAGAVAGTSEALGALSRDVAEALRALPLPPPGEDAAARK